MSFHFLLSHACDFRFLHCIHGPSHSPIYTVSHLCPIPIFFPANHSRAFDGSMYMQILLLKICFFSFNLLFLHLTSWLIIVHGCALDHFRLPVCIHTYCNITLWNIYELSTHKHKKKDHDDSVKVWEIHRHCHKFHDKQLIIITLFQLLYFRNIIIHGTERNGPAQQTTQTQLNKNNERYQTKFLRKKAHSKNAQETRTATELKKSYFRVAGGEA